MEFDDIQKVWDAQNNEPIYVINERALRNRIAAKKDKASHITNASELLALFVNIGAAAFIFGSSLHRHSTNAFLYLGAFWMFGTAVYVLINRLKRFNAARQFDRSMYGDLRHAIALATYQVRLSYLLRWNMLPLALLMAFGIWQSGQSLWLAVGLLVFLFVANYAAGWEHKLYKARKRELEVLQEKLNSEEASEHHA